MDIKKKMSYEVSLTAEEVNVLNKKISKVREKGTPEDSGSDLILTVEKMVAIAYVTGVRAGKMEIMNDLE